MSPDLDKKIEKFQNKIDKYRTKIKDSDIKDAFQRVFDNRTRFELHKLIRNNNIKEIVGIISQGKEANVFFGYDINEKPIAIKIYKIDIQSAKWMKNYIIGDPRFKKIGNSVDKIIFTWCLKEYSNLNRIFKAGINCPQPIIAKKNILVMSYIGEYDGTPAKRLKESIKSLDNIKEQFDESIMNLKLMYNKANLVHGDYNEFNILCFNRKQYIIDVSQAISLAHPKHLSLLIRDIKNIINFYSKYIDTPSVEEVYNTIIET